MLPTQQQIEAYIRNRASMLGIDPDTAVRVWKSEGATGNPNEAWQSRVVKNGVREPSYGPFQLYMNGGLGSKFQAATGQDPRNPATWPNQVDFALNYAKNNGWGSWYGAKNTGISNWQGIKSQGAAPVTPVLNQAQQDFVNNNPQPGGYGPGLGDPNQPTDNTAVASVPGSMVPDNSIPSYVADYATEDPNKPNFLQKLGKALEGMKGPRPPYLPPHPLGAGPGNQLLQYLNSPTYADLFMKKRMGG